MKRQGFPSAVRMMWAIALSSLLWLTASSALAQAVPDEGTPVAVAPSGEQIFEVHCVGCHPNGGNIIRRRKSLKMNALQRNHMDSVGAIAQIVTNGKRPMSAYRDTLSEEEIQAVSQFVLDQAEQGWPH